MEVTLKNVPMMTADGQPIKINDVLYSSDWETGYGYQGTAKSEITAWRVFYINQTTREIRARCVTGCESSFSFADSKCSRTKLFKKLSSAIDRLHKSAEQDLAKCKKKSKEINRTIAAIWAEKRRLNKIKKVKASKAVKIDSAGKQ